MSGDQFDLDAVEARTATSPAPHRADVAALVAEVRRLRAKVERVEAAVSDNGPRTMMLADDVRAALDGSA